MDWNKPVVEVVVAGEVEQRTVVEPEQGPEKEEGAVEDRTRRHRNR